MNTVELKDRVAIITGAGGGLGRAMCLAFAQAGADLVVTDIRAESMNEVVERVTQLNRKVMAIVCDVTNSSEVNQMVDRAISQFGHVDILVNNAGIVREQQSKPIWEITDREWHLGIDTNLTGTFFCSRAIAKHMIERSQGVVINVASAAGIRGISEQFMYCSAKAGVVLLTQSLALTWAPYKIRVNCIAPGTVRTFRSSEEYEKRGRFVPLGRVGEPEEISKLARYLASDASSYVTGQIFIIDGGSMAGGFAPIGYAPIIPLEE